MPRINFNSPAMINVSRLNQVERKLNRSMEHVSSGVRINRPADDVAAHGISEYLRGQIRCISVASRNVQDGMALMNVAESALNEMDSMLNRMRELSVQAANDTYTDEDRFDIQIEMNKLKVEINYISSSAHYNGHHLLDGTGDWGKDKGGFIQMGPNNASDIDFISYKIAKVDTVTMGIDDVDVRTRDGAAAAIDKVKNAGSFTSTVRAGLGAITNRLEQAWRYIDEMGEGNQAFESKLKDTDIAEEMINITRDQIVSQYCTAMLAQANQTPQSILTLLRG